MIISCLMQSIELEDAAIATIHLVELRDNVVVLRITRVDLFLRSPKEVKLDLDEKGQKTASTLYNALIAAISG